jgi:hypothetical protein
VINYQLPTWIYNGLGTIGNLFGTKHLCTTTSRLALALSHERVFKDQKIVCLFPFFVWPLHCLSFDLWICGFLWPLWHLQTLKMNDRYLRRFQITLWLPFLYGKFSFLEYQNSCLFFKIPIDIPETVYVSDFFNQ